MNENFVPKKNVPLMKTAAKFALICLIAALIASAISVMAGLGSKWEWWNFRTGLAILQVGGYLSAIAAVLSLAGCIWAGFSGSRLGFGFALVGLIVCLAVVGSLWQWTKKAQTVPRIHDISTDTENPPSFKAILPLRKNAPNPSEYGGPEIAAMQRVGYPDLTHITLQASANEAFQKALSAAIKMDWDIVEANQGEGRIEATDTTFWFGFKDDIVVRITPDKNGSRIDVRSVSRVGLSDVGTNAKRIHAFMKEMGK